MLTHHLKRASISLFNAVISRTWLTVIAANAVCTAAG
jgi:hypothetical protein